jgi:hypothetical protein
MSLQAEVDAWTSHYIQKSEAALARLQGALSPPDAHRRPRMAELTANITAAKRHRSRLVSTRRRPAHFAREGARPQSGHSHREL